MQNTVLAARAVFVIKPLTTQQQRFQKYNSLLFYISYLNSTPKGIAMLRDDLSAGAHVVTAAPITPLDAEKKDLPQKCVSNTSLLNCSSEFEA